MNADRKKAIDACILILSQASKDLDKLKDDEQKDADNLSEEAAEGEAGEKANENIESIQEAVASVDEAIAHLEEIE